jgi:ABC-type antimicrobial peptide transport system permease subunit
MSFFSLLLRNLFFHWRGNLAVLLGTGVGAAVLTGALLVGDSLRGSLRQRTEDQLNGVNSVLIGPKFIRERIPLLIDLERNDENDPYTLQPGIVIQGSVAAGEGEQTTRVGKASIYGIRGWPVGDAILNQNEPQAILSPRLAEQLKINVGDKIRINIQKVSAIPRSSVLGRRNTDDSTKAMTVTVRRILNADEPGSLFSLNPSPQAPLNLYLPLPYLQRQLDQKERVNALFYTGNLDTAKLNQIAKENISLEDWGIALEIHGKGENRYLSVESKQLLLEPNVVESIKKTAESLQLKIAPCFVYLVNRITPGNQANPPANVVGLLTGSAQRLSEIPYSIVAALETNLPAPLGPFVTDTTKPLRDDEIVLVDWFQPTLIGSEVGKPIALTYFKPEIEGRIEEATASFKLRELIPLKGVVADPNLTPPFPGITDRRSLTSGGVDGWDPPFPYDSTSVGLRDELFWDRHKTTPKAFITLATGQKLWGSRFGDVTSIRVAPREGQSLDELRKEFASRLIGFLNPEAAGLAFEPIRERLITAGKGSTDFGLLFLAFSFFLILAALMLVALLFRLNLDRRASEMGLLLATGFTPKQVRRLLLLEGFLLALVGSLLGLSAATLYASGMIHLLISLWPTPGVETFLQLHMTPLSLGIGLFAAVLMSQLAILWAIRILKRLSPSSLLNGQTTPPPDPSKPLSENRWSRRIVVVSLVSAVGLAVMAPTMPPGEAQAGTFFGSGAMLLTCGLALLWSWMKRERTSSLHTSLVTFGSRNATRNPTRSLLTAALLAFAAFLLVAVESFRRQPEKDFAEKTGGSGGFPLIAESDVPIFLDLKLEKDREELIEQLERFYQSNPKALQGKTFREKRQEIAESLSTIQVFPFRRKGGDDASCLNLYQATRPRILGVPDALAQRGGFQFVSLLKSVENPWSLLSSESDPKKPIPIFVEQNTAMWMLKKGLGDILELPDESGELIPFQIVGLLKDSVFQSEILISDQQFRMRYPRQEGFTVFLIDPNGTNQSQVETWLSEGFASYGFTLQSTKERVAAYLAVVNTYLTTFQLLGGFGLLLGVLGLAVVLLRSVWERRSELALLRAVGYSAGNLNRVVLSENLLLLLIGLSAGIVAALVSVAPHLLGGGQIPWLRLTAMLGAVLLVGIIITLLTTRSSLRTPIVPALRRE